MKKIVSCVFAAACVAMCALSFTACGGSNIPKYYGKTLTFTGNALPIDWNIKCAKDNGPDNSWNESTHGLSDNTDYSYKELLTKYWDRIDFEHEIPDSGKPWASMKGKTVDEFIAEVDRGLEGLYDGYMGLSQALKFEFGEKSDRALKMTVLEDEGDVVYDLKFVETDEQLNEAKSKFDPKADYLQWITWAMQDGRSCIAFVDDDGNGLYDGYMAISLTAYVVNSEKPTVDLYWCRRGEEVDGRYASDTFAFSQISSELCLWGYENNNGATSIMQLPFYPEIVLE